MEEFEQNIEKSLANLPEKFSKILKEKQISVLAREKAPQEVKNRFKNVVVFGVFVGIPLGHLHTIATEPTRIELYKDSFEKMYTAPAEIEKQISKTVIHEVAHYFGFSEKEIRSLGY